MSDRWYVFREGRPPMGPVDAETIIAGIKSGCVKTDTRVSNRSEPPWRQVSSVPEFALYFRSSGASDTGEAPLAELLLRTPEEELRKAVRSALSEGVLNAEASQEELQKRFGVSPETVLRIMREEMRRRAGAEAPESHAGEGHSSTPAAALSSRLEAARALPAWMVAALLGGIAFMVVMTGWLFVACAR